MILTIVEKKILKNICAKIKVEKEIERRGDSISKITFGINFITTNNTHIYEERTILRNGNKN